MLWWLRETQFSLLLTRWLLLAVARRWLPLETTKSRRHSIIRNHWWSMCYGIIVCIAYSTAEKLFKCYLLFVFTIPKSANFINEIRSVSKIQHLQTFKYEKQITKPMGKKETRINISHNISSRIRLRTSVNRIKWIYTDSVIALWNTVANYRRRVGINPA